MSSCMRLAPSTANAMYWSAALVELALVARSSSWQKLATLRSGSCRSCEAT